MELLSDPQIWISLFTLTLLEIVLGIDNLIFIAIMADKLPEDQRKKARNLGLALALVTRILLLLSINWVIGLTDPISWLSIDMLHFYPSGRDMILLIGGIFLLGKATLEIHEKLEGEESHGKKNGAPATLLKVVMQILVLDMVFSIDSVITAVGMADEVVVMITAVIIAIIIMLLSLDYISNFVSKHPTVKMLALSFLLLIGLSLITESFHSPIPRGYVYFAMGFSVFVEMLNIAVKKKNGNKPIKLLNTPHLDQKDKS